MTDLVIDSGGRGMAIAEALGRNRERVVLFPGNGGARYLNEHYGYNIRTPDALEKRKKGEPADVYYNRILDYIQNNGITRVVIGPEQPLTDGFVDMCADRMFEDMGIEVIGPDRTMAKMESSKAYANDICAAGGARIPEYSVFTDPKKAVEYVEKAPFDVCVKADGLCGGKGAHPTETKEDAIRIIRAMMIQDPNQEEGKLLHDDAGKKVVIERNMHGSDASWFGYTHDGKTISKLGLVLDYPHVCPPGHPYIKRFYGGENLITGGLGAEMPHPLHTDDLEQRIVEEIVGPQLRAFQDKEGMPYKGFIYSGLMLVMEKNELVPYQCEWNIRLGDPEAQPLLARLKNFSAFLDGEKPEFEDRFVAAPCAIAGPRYHKKGWFTGYPKRSHAGEEIIGLENVPRDIMVLANGFFFDGNREGFDGRKGVYHHDGGRVFTAVAKGDSRDEAARKALSIREYVWFESMRFREDFGNLYRR